MNRNGRLTWNNRDDMEGGVTAAAIEQEAEGIPFSEHLGKLSIASHRTQQAEKDAAHWRERAEKAEKERDEALRTVKEALDSHDETLRDIAAGKYAAESRPLTPDAITDEMVARARKSLRSDGWTVGEDDTGLRAALAAALTEPTRPEGAEEIEALIETSPWHLAGSCASEADWLAERGVRVVTEEQP